MRLSVTPDARQALTDHLARDRSRAALRIMFAGGCGALGYRLTAAADPMAGDEAIQVDGLRFFLDYKSRIDLDGARIELGDGPDEVVILHDAAVVGSLC
jgi:Fe-S cluster assembly iron-binding protein IscA